MPRFYVEKDGEWNVFDTLTNDFLLDEFVCLNALKAHLLYAEWKRIESDIDSLLSDNPKVNVMKYQEAIDRLTKSVIEELRAGGVKRMSTNTKPPSTKPVEFKTVDGKIHRGFFLRDANRYVRGVNRWKDTDIDAWFDDDRVVAWGYVTEQVDGQMNLFEGGEHYDG